MHKTIDATYDDGILKPKTRLPLGNHAHVRLLVIRPTDPVRRTAGLFRVSKSIAKVLIYDDSLLDG